MTRKDYELIARVVAQIEDPTERRATARRFSYELRCRNTAFNQDKFIRHCNAAAQENENV